MDLYAIYKENCSENAHVADLVMMAHMSPQWTTVKLKDGSTKQHFIRRNWAIHAFFDTISRGKKTDAKGIRYALIEFLVRLFMERLQDNPEWTLGVDTFVEQMSIISDNCSNQNKCAQHYFNMATLLEELAPRLAVLYLQHRKRHGQLESRPSSPILDEEFDPLLNSEIYFEANEANDDNDETEQGNDLEMLTETEHGAF
jgi:hypothetical protein